ncbi:nucleoside 2-deoxyribosyltransferase domain-containing protein [Glycomyces sp. YM15]|uniref:nucleoside 2-deoxyribosyltransferase domain-containing protein n=1 Tax=Glycomyces sp. YM15 TaxID=2800446 RepID=UPI001966895A|nr:nucleoside 2-deoxyribosyltransferase domain-containing protein [Glycomyces sp. YM15]
MASEVVIVHANETPPESWHAAVFLAGPLPRSADVPAWNRDAAALFQDQWRHDGRLVVFTPELREGVLADYTGQADWEDQWMNAADAIVFWVPRDMATMPALTTNIEYGAWVASGKVVFGAPPTAPKNEYLRHLAEVNGVPVRDTLADTVRAALAQVGTGAHRTEGERTVPLQVWATDSFQAWHRAQRAAGNRLVSAHVEWTFRVGPARDTVFYWAAHVAVHVAAEDRVKDNEVVLSRPDTAQVALYCPGRDLDDTVVVLVREFRSPAATPDGFVHELPGGGSTQDPTGWAVDEVREETGLVLDADRLRPLGARQVAATVTTHRAHLFAAEITGAELEWLRARQDIPGGDGLGSEQTWIELATYAEIRDQRLVDWATFGMITQALAGRV